MKINSKIWRVLLILITALSLYFSLLGKANLKIANTHQMAKDVISRVIDKSNNKDLKDTVEIVEASGLEDMLISGLPKKFQLDFSYANIYHLSSKYDQTGQITAQDLGLKHKNKLEEVINRFIADAVNARLKEESQQVTHIISIYRYSIFVIILLYLLAAILIWLKRYWASLPLLLASLSSFGALWYFCREANDELQSKVYSGISVQINTEVWLGLILGLIVALGWPYVLKLIKKEDAKNA